MQMSRDERMAFFINIYNALVVHAMALFGPAESTIKRCAACSPSFASLLGMLYKPGAVPASVHLTQHHKLAYVTLSQTQCESYIIQQKRVTCRKR